MVFLHNHLILNGQVEDRNIWGGFGPEQEIFYSEYHRESVGSGFEADQVG